MLAPWHSYKDDHKSVIGARGLKMRRYLRLGMLVGILPMALSLSGCLGPLFHPPSTDGGAVIIPETTKVLDDQTTALLVTVSPDSAILTFAAATPFLNRLKPGDVLVAASTEKTPYGLLRQVERVRRSQGTIVVETSQATLDQAISTGSFSLERRLTPNDVMSISAIDGVVLQPSALAPFSQAVCQGFYWTLNFEPVEDVTVEGYICLDPWLSIGADIDSRWSLRVKHFHALVSATVTAELSVTIGAHHEFTILEQPVAQVWLTPITVFVGPVPVVFTPVLTITLRVTGEVSPGITTSVTPSVALKLGASYDSGTWTNLSGASSQFEWESPRPSLGCKFRVTANVHQNVLLYGAVGPYVMSDFYLELDADVFRDPMWELYAGLEGSLGIEVIVIGKKIASYHVDTALGYRRLLASAPRDAGTIAGIVKDAVSRTPLGGVSVRAFATALAGQAETNTDGIFSLQLPPRRDYIVIFSKAGYLPATYRNVEVQANDTTHLEPVLQIDTAHSGNGSVSGTIRNALTGEGVSGVTVALREGINTTTGPVVHTTSTGTGGVYTFTNIAAGHYTGEVSGNGYTTTWFTVVCIGGTLTSGQDAVVTPILAPGQTRIILTWGETPTDLDSHLTGPLPDGTRFHIFYPYSDDNMGSPWPEYVKLDLDDVTSYGPETTTIYQQLPGVYRFSVHDYSNRYQTTSFALSNSGALVRVYRGSVLVASFTVPANQPGTLWTVFEMNGDTITAVNRLSYQSSPVDIDGVQRSDHRTPPKSMRAK